MLQAKHQAELAEASRLLQAAEARHAQELAQERERHAAEVEGLRQQLAQAAAKSRATIGEAERVFRTLVVHVLVVHRTPGFITSPCRSLSSTPPVSTSMYKLGTHPPTPSPPP